MIHLHLRSYFSFLDGLAAPGDYVQAAVQAGMPALGLADFHSLTGAIEFYDACTAAGIQPLLGLGLRVALPPSAVPGPLSAANLLLYAQDLAGWGSLCRLASLVQGSEAVLPLDSLAEHQAGLLCLSGGRHGWTGRAAARGDLVGARANLAVLAEIFTGRLYVELQNHDPGDTAWNERLAAAAARLALPLVATHQVHYLHAAQADLQRTAAAIRLLTPRQQLSAEQLAPPGAWFLPPQEMVARCAAFPAALERTHEIAERCRLVLPLGQPHYPQIDLPPGETPEAELRRRAQLGAFSAYGKMDETIQTRLDHELEVINARGYAPLFLIMQDILDHARRSGVPTASRGSASSSLVAHCLGITTPDPLRLNLYFERFLNPARATPPDIDTDLCSQRRDSVIEYVYERFGRQHVAMVCTINRFRRRSALREAAKAYGMANETMSRLVDELPQRWWGPRAQAEAEDPYAGLAARYPGPREQEIFTAARALVGLPHHLSIHPGGVVIAPGLLHDLVPTQTAPKGVVITQFDLESIERLGLVKIDLLGIRGLSVLGDVAEGLQRAASASLFPPQPGSGAVTRLALEYLENIPLSDQATSETVRQGRTIGCFQIESPGMRLTLREIQARTVDDILAALALYRPGPLTGGLKDAFVRRHKGEEPVNHLHPALAPLLDDTYGVILYQEQVLRIAHELAGLSLADADLLRRAMSHFDPGEQMKTLRQRFIAGAEHKGGVPAAVGERLWDMMAAFAGYGFPKAHAASYAVVSWRAAWCKTHYPALFMAAVLANWGGYYSQRVYLTEARRMGLRLRPPLVNCAQVQFSVQDVEGAPALVMGLDQVRDLSRRTIGRILSQRPFHNLADFLARVDPRPVEADNLVRVGALAGFGAIPQLLDSLQGGWRAGQLPLFTLAAASQSDWSLAERVAAQEALLGVGVDAHPLELIDLPRQASGALSTVEAAGRRGQRVRVVGMRQSWRRSISPDGEPIYWMTLEDLEGLLVVLLRRTLYQRSRKVMEGPGPYLVEGVIEDLADEQGPLLRAERIERLSSTG